MLVAHLPHLSEVLQGDRLASSRVVGDGHHDEGDALHTHRGDRLLKRLNVHVALERMLGLAVASLRDQEVAGLGALELDIGSGGVEVGVGGHHIAFSDHRRKEKPFGSPALMGGQDLVEAGDRGDRLAEPLVGAAAGVRLVTSHHPRPLTRGHRTRA